MLIHHLSRDVPDQTLTMAVRLDCVVVLRLLRLCEFY